MDLNIIKFLAENFASKIPLIHFTGGKPLIHPQILHRERNMQSLGNQVQENQYL